MNKPLAEQVKAAVEPYRSQLQKARELYYRERIHAVQQALEENQMDANAVAPYPRASVGGIAYFSAKERYEFCRAWFKQTAKNPLRRLNDPEPVKLREDWEKEVTRRAEKEASCAVESFCSKMHHKLSGVQVASVQHAAGLLEGGTLVCCLQDGSELLLHTQIIYKTSCRGKPFNQFPSRFTVAGKKVSESELKSRFAKA